MKPGIEVLASELDPLFDGFEQMVTYMIYVYIIYIEKTPALIIIVSDSI